MNSSVNCDTFEIKRGENKFQLNVLLSFKKFQLSYFLLFNGFFFINKVFFALKLSFFSVNAKRHNDMNFGINHYHPNQIIIKIIAADSLAMLVVEKSWRVFW